MEGEAGYRQAKDFMKMIMPSHAKNVKHYTDGMPLFARHQVESYLADMFNPVVQLKSGGYIVIGITEALVAVDVNSGKATKEGSIEETALKTNLEAAEEVARQVRLRDLAGLLVIDFIDMDERRNNNAVEKRLKDRLKSDRARIQVSRISAFGLLEMSRQRLRPGMLEATTQPCHHCHGTGLIRSDDSLALSILRQLEEEGTRRRSREILLTAPVGIVNFIMNQKREYLADIESRHGLSVRIEADPALVPPDYKIEKFKTATRRVAQAAPILSMDTALMDEIEEADEAEVIDAVQADDAEDGGKKRRRRRRGGRGRKKTGAEAETPEAEAADATETAEAAEAPTAEDAAEAPAAPEVDAEADAEEKPKRRRSRGGRGQKKAADAEETSAEATEAPSEDAGDGADAEPEAQTEEFEPQAEEHEVKAEEPVAEKPKRTRRKKKEEVPAPAAEEVAAVATAVEAPVEKTPEPEPVLETKSDTAVVEAEPAPAVAEAEPAKPKRRGWWSLGG